MHAGFHFVFLSVLFSPLRDGATVPMGPGVKTGVGKRNSYSLLYNEFIVYNPAQTRMRYLLRIKFNYSSLWWGCAGKRGMTVWNLGISEGFPSDKAGEETSLVIWRPSSWPWMFHLVTILITSSPFQEFSKPQCQILDGCSFYLLLFVTSDILNKRKKKSHTLPWAVGNDGWAVVLRC